MLLFYFDKWFKSSKNSILPHFWKAYLTREIEYRRTGQNIVVLANYCSQHITVSEPIFVSSIYCVKPNIPLFNFPLSTLCGRIMLRSAYPFILCLAAACES